MNKMIFVGGIHGVGKTYLCNQISNEYTLPHFSASKLISELKNEEFKNNKLIEGIDKNQDYLVTAVNNLCIENEWFLLDGHFCLLNKEGIITKVPPATFKHIRPKAVILLIDSIEKISERLALRDSKNYSADLLDTFQKTEVDYAREIANENNIPILVCQSTDDLNNINQFIKTFINT